MMTAEGPKVLEFNVRFGDPETQALMMLLDGDFGRLLSSAARGELDAGAVTLKPGAAMVVVLASKGYPGACDTGHEITGLDGLGDETLQVFHAGTRLEDGRLVNSGGRVLGLTAWGGDLSEAARRCYEAADTIQFRGMSLRRDIGWRALGKEAAR
jgi:phosphoribosylamine--glycine ligase